MEIILKKQLVRSVKKHSVLSYINLVALVVTFTLPTKIFSTEKQRNPFTGYYNNDIHELEEQVWITDYEHFPHLEKRITRIIQIEPRSSFAHYLLAHLYVRKYAINPSEILLLRKASELAQQAIELDKDQDYGYIVIAEILDIMGQTQNGLKILEKSIHPGISSTWRTHFIKAKLEANLQSTDVIRSTLNKAMMCKNSQHDVIVPYIIALLQTEDDDEYLIERLDNWHKKYPNKLFLQTKAIALTNIGQYNQAHRIYKKIYIKNPDFNEAKINDAILLYQHLNNPKESKALFTSVLRDKSKSNIDDQVKSIVLTHLGIIQLKQKEVGQANQSFFKAITLSDNQSELIHYITKIYHDSDRDRDLVRLLEKLADEVTGTSIIYALLGETLSEDLAEHQAAVEAFTNAIILESGRSDYFNGLGLVYYRMKNIPKALAFFSTASRIDPEDATAKYNEACALARLGRSEEALASLQKAIDLDPTLQRNAKLDQDFDSIKKMEQFENMIVQYDSFKEDDLQSLSH